MGGYVPEFYQRNRLQSTLQFLEKGDDDCIDDIHGFVDNYEEIIRARTIVLYICFVNL